MRLNAEGCAEVQTSRHVHSLSDAVTFISKTMRSGGQKGVVRDRRQAPPLLPLQLSFDESIRLGLTTSTT